MACSVSGVRCWVQRVGWGQGFRVQGFGFRVMGSGCRVQGAGFRVQGAGCRVQGSGCRVQGPGSRTGVHLDQQGQVDDAVRRRRAPHAGWGGGDARSHFGTDWIDLSI